MIEHYRQHGSTMRIAPTLTLLLFALPSMALADVIVLKTGRRLVGRAEVRDERVTLETHLAPVQMDMSSIRDLVWESDADDFRGLGDQCMVSQMPSEAATYYHKSLECEPFHPKTLEALARTVPPLLAMVRESTEEGDFEEAQRLLDQAADGITADHRAELNQAGARLYHAWGLEAQKAGDLSAAMSHFERALAHEPEHREVAALLLELRKEDTKEQEILLREYRQKLESTPDDLALIESAVDLYLRMELCEEALPWIERLCDAPGLEEKGYDRIFEQAVRDASKKVPFSRYPQTEEAKRLAAIHRRGANRGILESTLKYASFCENGYGCAQDSELAVSLYRKAMNAGSTQAMYYLGLLHQAGRGVEKNPTEAARLFEIGALKGDALCMYMLSLSYTNASGVAQDHDKALEWMEKSAAYGYKPAKSQIANYNVAMEARRRIISGDTYDPIREERNARSTGRLSGTDMDALALILLGAVFVAAISGDSGADYSDAADRGDWIARQADEEYWTKREERETRQERVARENRWELQSGNIDEQEAKERMDRVW